MILKIEAPQENKIVVELTAQDMSELDITYEEMDYSNIETRRVIWTILDRVRLALRRDIDPSGKLTIESIPTAGGGCVLFFTVPDEAQDAAGRPMLRIRKEPAFLWFVPHDLDALLRCAARLRRDVCPLPRSDLYLWQERYVLLLYGSVSPELCRVILPEYGTLQDHGVPSPAVLLEHGKQLAQRDAVEKLTIGL